MCEYVGTPGYGKFKDFSSRSTSRRTPRKAAIERAGHGPESASTTWSSATRCRPRSTRSTARVTSALKAGTRRLTPRADRQPALRFGHPVDRQRRADDAARRGDHGARRRHGEHEPGAVRAATARAQGFRFGNPPQLAGHALRQPAGSVLRAVHGADRGEGRRNALGISRAEQDEYALRSHHARRRRGDRGALRRGDRAGHRSRRARASSPSTPTTTSSRTLRSRRSRQAARGVRQGGHGHGRQRVSGIVDGAAALVLDHRPSGPRPTASTSGRARAFLGHRRRRSRGDGHRSRPRDPQVPRATPADRRTRSTTASRSTRPSPPSTSRARRSSASTASAATSTAVRSRWATRWVPPARVSCSR